MRAQRWSTLVAAGALVLAPSVVSLGPASAVGPYGAKTWLGIDGQMHEDTVGVLAGKPGSSQYFNGYDFDDACWGGAEFAKGIRILGRLARIIRASGRTVVWTVVPNKASALSDELDLTTIPHGSCTLKGLAQQEALLRSNRDPDFVPVLDALARPKAQLYWNNDSHWTSVGAAIWAQRLARRLDPKLAARQEYFPTTETLQGEFNVYEPWLSAESAPGLRPTDFVKVRTTKGFDPDSPERVAYTWFDVRWHTTPARKAWGGKTLLLGDSMTFMGLRTLRPLFSHGRYLWWNIHSPKKLAGAVGQADTVVMETLQRVVDCYPAARTDDLVRVLEKTLKPLRR